MQKQDIFDRIMKLPVLRMFEPCYKKYKEILLYLFFGFLTFLISVLTYAYFNQVCELNELVANIASWIIAVFFAFITNQIWVFQVKPTKIPEFISYMFHFYIGRLFTLAVEEAILAVFVSWLRFDSLIIKVIAQIIVIILNYIISKLIIFKR